ncbi:ATP-binding cassette domain-containing protein [Paracerasibacillus soli]|uniref:ATP-binding cassette domain-containing protein n=1 Tax=Paracerasibacillus soli TaxID=480284 RepID=A0ABU5CR65_9BACI|nr:ATP-binding cassette domain-containing protein [Virgibacillus soli]MDY0408853.1 ATP-binding cassette domain-containing protein [Virgibacillus soli]
MQRDSVKLHLEVNNISFNYNNLPILKDVSLSIDGPGLYTLFGESGSGKTTLINILSLIQKPLAGEITIFNERVDFKNETQIQQLRNKIAYFFQDLNLIESLTIRENLDVISLINGQPLSEEYVTIYSKSIRIYEKLDIPVNHLSGGERQRASLLKVLVFDYPLILLDEPTNNLYRDNISTIIELLNEIKKDRMVLVVTHSDLIAKNANQVYLLSELNKGIGKNEK